MFSEEYVLNIVVEEVVAALERQPRERETAYVEAARAIEVEERKHGWLQSVFILLASVRLIFLGKAEGSRAGSQDLTLLEVRLEIVYSPVQSVVGYVCLFGN